MKFRKLYCPVCKREIQFYHRTILNDVVKYEYSCKTCLVIVDVTDKFESKMKSLDDFSV